MIAVALDWAGYVVAIVVMLELATRILTRRSDAANFRAKDQLGKNSSRSWRPTRTIAGTAALATFVVPRLLESVTIPPWSEPVKEPILYSIMAVLALVSERPNALADEGTPDTDPSLRAMEQLDGHLTDLLDCLDHCTRLCIDTQMSVQQTMTESKGPSRDRAAGMLRQGLMELERKVQSTMAALPPRSATVTTEVDP